MKEPYFSPWRAPPPPPSSPPPWVFLSSSSSVKPLPCLPQPCGSPSGLPDSRVQRCWPDSVRATGHTGPRLGQADTGDTWLERETEIFLHQPCNSVLSSALPGIIPPLLIDEELKLREVRQLAQGHLAKRQNLRCSEAKLCASWALQCLLHHPPPPPSTTTTHLHPPPTTARHPPRPTTYLYPPPATTCLPPSPASLQTTQPSCAQMWTQMNCCRITGEAGGTQIPEPIPETLGPG